MSSKLECPNCGYLLNSAEKVCKYCGSLNSGFVEVKQAPKPRELQTVLSHNYNNNNNSNNNQQVKKDKDFGCLIFVLLLIFFWPAAIIYLLVKGLSK